MGTVSLWPPICPPVGVQQQGWEHDRPAAPGPSTPCSPGTSWWSRRDMWFPVKAPSCTIVPPQSSGLKACWGLPCHMSHLLLSLHSLWWSFPFFLFFCSVSVLERETWRLFKSDYSLFKQSLCPAVYWVFLNTSSEELHCSISLNIFCIYLTFSIHFMVTAAGSIETPHPLFWNLGFPDKVFRKALLNVWLSHTDLRHGCCRRGTWDLGASVWQCPHAGSPGVPVMQRDAALSAVSTQLCLCPGLWVASHAHPLHQGTRQPTCCSQWTSLSPGNARQGGRACPLCRQGFCPPFAAICSCWETSPIRNSSPLPLALPPPRCIYREQRGPT